MTLLSKLIQNLKDQWHTLDPSLREVRLNRIDELATDILINAEKKCIKFRNSEVDYSPETKSTGKTWHFWKILLRHKSHERN